MACFDNLVALKELCTSVTPVSGIYLNDVSVDLNLVSSVITKSDGTNQEFIDAKINLAIEQIRNEVYSQFSNKIKATSLTDNARVGYTLPNMVTVAGGGYRGITFEIPNNANFFQLELASLDLHVNFTGTVNVLVYDLDQNLLLETIPVEAVAGQIITVYPHKVFKSNKKCLNLWIGYLSTGISSYKTVTHKGQCCGNYCLNTRYTKARGTVATSFIESGQTGIQDTAGISFTYSISCDPYGWICSYARLFSLPIAYKVASDVYRQGVLQTPQTRSNNSTTVNAELMERNYNFYESKYQESMKRVLSGIKLPCDNVCFECKSLARTTLTLP